MSKKDLAKISGGYRYPAEPRQPVLDLVRLLQSPSDILDIGAGFGNNCITLLERGHRVTATETNEEALRALEQLRARYPGQLTIKQEPIQSLAGSPHYDAVICTMVLHFLDDTEARQAVKKMKKITKPGGYNVVMNYLTGQQIGDEYTWMLTPHELPNLYSDWRVVMYQERYAYGLERVRTLRQLARWLLGRKGYKSARLIAQR